jgi:DNA-binding response OmpR family regulator/nitrogen-specific signal transduction histidine kinase
MRRQGIKKIEMRQQEKQAKALHELDMMKIKFLTNLSHEFRTPISLILSPTEKLLNEYTDSRLTSQLQMIRRNSKRLLNLVNQLLDFRKLEENELSLNVSDGELVAFVKDLTDSFKDLSESKKIRLVFTSPENKVFARFDPEKIERIIFNLLSNAFKFTPSGGVITIQMTEKPVDEKTSSILIAVSDTGIGIPEEKLQLVFKRFYQTDELPSAINQGTGIGLSISKDLAEMHGGTLEVTSKKGSGSTFTLTILVEKIEEPRLITTGGLNETLYQRLETKDNETQLMANHEGDLPHVLVIEDNEDMRQYLFSSLKTFYKVTEAEDGHTGWQKALSCHPDLIISDISMPHMDGISLSKKIKTDKRTNHIPIILLTALTSQANLLEGLETGASDYLTKPFDFEVLNLKIRNLLKLNKSLKDTYSKQLVVTRNDIEIVSSSEKFLKSVVSYVEENMNNVRFSVDELSHHFNMSRGTLYYKILELTGLPPVEFMRTIKLDKAAVMLEKSDLSVSQIAYATGFATPHYFTKSFKSKFNVLPKDYRKKVKGEEHHELIAKAEEQHSSLEKV